MKIEVKNLSFSYGSGQPVVSGVSFDIKSGQVLAIIGRNGSGKTTLLKLIIGLLKPQTGESLLDGKNMAEMGEKELFSHVSYVPQASIAQSSYTVLETVLLGLSGTLTPFSIPGEKEIRKAEETLSFLRIGHLRDRHIDELSGGELRMVMIAKAVVKDPDFLVLDEPESGLDFKNQLVILETVEKLAARGVGVVYNTHYPEHALRVSDWVLFMNGKTYLSGETHETLTEENIRQAFGVKAKILTAEEDGKPIYSVIPTELVDERMEK